MSVNQKALFILPNSACTHFAGVHLAYARSTKMNLRLALLFIVVFADVALPPIGLAAFTLPAPALGVPAATVPISPEDRRIPTSKWSLNVAVNPSRSR